ncbi:MAG: RNA methyltransferase [Elusimicrobia bacterium]|nr:RNA methyltransferase [Candidatus Liberimonas magnetica]
MYNKIDSADNVRIKHLKKLLSDRDYRYLCREYVLEGLRALDTSKNIEYLFVRKDKKIPDVKCKQLFLVSEAVFDKISDTENSQGFLALTALNISGKEEIRKNARYVLLDKLQDPGNLGTIIRTACAFSIDGIIITPGCVDPFSPKVVRSSMGALEKIKIIKIGSVSEIKDFTIIAADKGGVSIDGFSWPGYFILAIGNEANGLSKTLKDSAVAVVSIQISNNIESLNAAIACGILLNQARQKSN